MPKVGRPQLTANELSGLEYYLSQIKDAGVAIKVLNEPADQINVELVVLYDPSILKATYISDADADNELRQITLSPIDDDSKDLLDEVVRGVVSQLPFNGEYRNSDLMAAVQGVEEYLWPIYPRWRHVLPTEPVNLSRLWDIAVPTAVIMNSTAWSLKVVHIELPNDLQS